MEDHENMEQFVENKQGYVIDSMNAVAGCGGIGVGEVMGSSEEILGVKYDEQHQEKNDFGDDDELKYVKEVQQSEKQHSVENVGDGRNSNELAEKEEEVDKYKVGIEEENLHNQKDFENITHSIANDNINGHGDHNACDQLKQVPETPSPIVAFAGADYIGYSSAEHYQDQYEMEKDEDSSSLTTNTTNGSSLSENIMQAIARVEDGVSPFIAAAVVEDQTNDANIHQNTDFEPMPSQLNPEAKEFVPIFESNLLSPNSLSGMAMETLEDDELEKCYFGQTPSAVPRYFKAEDDLVAQSPRKGRGDDMDTISVPAVQEFEEEADQRPHELEANDQTNTVHEILNADRAHQGTLSDDMVSENNDLKNDSDLIDKKAHLIDHGPETYVDQDVDIDIIEQPYIELSVKENDPMKQSIYVSSDEAIENVLNSVQPIPTEIDSINNSFTEEVSAVVPIVDKELLQIEEKENISKSPSTEEIQLNLQSPIRDISQVSFDTKDDPLMHGSFYAEQAEDQCTNNGMEDIDYLAALDTANLLGASNKRNETTDIISVNLEKEVPNQSEVQGTSNFTEDIHNSPTLDTANILEASNKINEIPKINEINLEKELSNLLETNITQNEQYATHSSLANEKHLMEETKELQTNSHRSSIEHLMSEMAINDDGIRPQVDEEEAAPDTINNDESTNSSESFVNKCEQSMMIDKNTTDTKQGEHTDAENPASQHMSISNEYDLIQIEESSKNNKIASQPTVTIVANETETTKTERLSEGVTSGVEAVSSIKSFPSQFGEDLAPSSISDFNNMSEHFELTHQKEIGESINFGEEKVLCGYPCKKPEDITETKLAPVEEFSLGEKDAGQQNMYEKEIAIGNEETKAENSSETIVDNAVAEKVLDKVTGGDCRPSSIKADLPLEACNTITVKKTGIKNTNTALKAKTTQSLSSLSKKLTTTDVAKKPTGVVTKPKLPAVKSSTISLSSDRKPNKTTSAVAANARKPTGTAAAAPKIPLKANVSSRSTQISTSITKTTTSRPVAASRTISSAITAARKPAAIATSCTAKTRPASASAVPAKPNTLGVSGTSTNKPKVASPRATLTSQMRKPVSSTVAAKSPVKSTIPNSSAKPASSILGTRPKPASSTVNTGGSATIKTTTVRAAPKVVLSSTTTARRLTVGGSTGGTGTGTTNTATKVTTARKSSPIKSTSGKTPVKPITSITNSNTKSVNKATPPKSTENKLNEQLEMNGGITSDKANDLNSINGSSQNTSVTGEHQQAFLGHEDLNKPHTIGSNLGTSEDFKRGAIDPLQEDLIGAYDH